MKTRREFMRFTLGGLACLGAAVMAPKSLMAKGTENPFNLDNVKKGLKKMDYLDTHCREFWRTWPEPDNTGFSITTSTSTTMYDEDGNIEWQTITPDVKWSKY